MEIRLSKDCNDKVPMHITMAKHGGLLGKKAPSLITVEAGTDRNDPKNWILNIPIYIFRAKYENLSTEVTVGDTMGFLNVKGAPVMPAFIDDKGSMHFFDIHEILEYDNMTSADLAMIDAIVIIMTPNNDKTYAFYLMGAKVKCGLSKDLVKIKGHFNLNGFDVDEFHDDMCPDCMDIDFPDADSKTSWDENGSTSTTKSFVVDDSVDDDEDEED